MYIKTGASCNMRVVTIAAEVWRSVIYDFLSREEWRMTHAEGY